MGRDMLISTIMVQYMINQRKVSLLKGNEETKVWVVMKFCKNCVLPNTKPGISFDSDGVCSACRSVEKKHSIDWKKRSKVLQNLWWYSWIKW